MMMMMIILVAFNVGCFCVQFFTVVLLRGLKIIEGCLGGGQFQVGCVAFGVRCVFPAGNKLNRVFSEVCDSIRLVDVKCS